MSPVAFAPQKKQFFCCRRFVSGSWKRPGCSGIQETVSQENDRLQEISCFGQDALKKNVFFFQRCVFFLRIVPWYSSPWNFKPPFGRMCFVTFSKHLPSKSKNINCFPSGGFNYFLDFHPDPWGNDPIWLTRIFCSWVAKNHQLVFWALQRLVGGEEICNISICLNSHTVDSVQDFGIKNHLGWC